MLKRSIENYYRELERLQRFGGTKNETSIRRAFAMLLLDYCKNRNFELVEERVIDNTRIRPDGTIIDELQLVWGYWESKDTKDDLNKEIEHKISIGYPTDNIIFENSERIILIQKGEEVLNCNCKIPTELDRALSTFINFERPEYKQFHDAIAKFKTDVPTIVKALKELIDTQSKTNVEYQHSIKEFWELCKSSINPYITENEISEMLIQHILTEDIFVKIFGDSDFHRYNNIANQLEKVIATFLTRERKINLLSTIESYYHVIRSRAANIQSHKEKQKFLKVVYENFYKAYNPDGADKLGVVYTPNDVVRFMVESSDYFTEKHFGKTFSDQNVEILDPATGTGTFITEIIDYIPAQYLEYKYKNEIHANEVAILPYYIANLNIEYTYQQKTQKYVPYNNICFVDTLENIKPLFQTLGEKVDDYKTSGDLFGTISKENIERINRQNDRKISVIIGNPPYNANQQNFNDFNKNKEYNFIDKRIKDTYIKKSKAQKTKVYDMFSRFFRWASDRIGNDGIVCFITNNAFINKKTYDGFRASIFDEFQFAYIVDLGGDIRELSGKDGIWLNENNTIFGVSAAVGISIAFLIKDNNYSNEKCKIKYIHPTDIRATRKEKIDYLNDNKIKDFPFVSIVPDKKNNWIHLGNNEFNTLMPLINKENKSEQLFSFSTLGVSTNRDEWVYDFDKKNLDDKIKFLIKTYNNAVEEFKKDDAKRITTVKYMDKSIKWSDSLENELIRLKKLKFNHNLIVQNSFRPFTRKYFYSEKSINDRLTQNHYDIFGDDLQGDNIIIAINISNKAFNVLASKQLVNLHFNGDSNCLSKYRYENNKQTENITDWGLQQFQTHYTNKKISKSDVFNYVYAILHNPAYRTKYENNLKRELPRIPFYSNFEKWTKWGAKLIQLHTEYETVKPCKQIEIKEFDKLETPKTKLKINKTDNEIIIDENTSLLNVPSIIYDYKLGNRSAVEWILYQYKEKNPDHETIKEKFNNYKFADYKLYVIDLILKVSNVSIETMKIINEMSKETE